jgi:hypothetical protein
VVVTSPNGATTAVAADGTPMWAFDPARIGIPNANLVIGGPNLLVYGQGQLAVVNRSGAIIGRAQLPKLTRAAGEDASPQVIASPTGTRWAWTLDKDLWVAGLGERPHLVKSWTGVEVDARQWSDAGVVVVKLGESCGGRPLSSVLVDPATGTETPLFGADRWPLDVHGGVQVATSDDQPTLFVAGAAQITRTYPLPVRGARVSPAAGRMFVSTFAMTGCGGRPVAATHVLEVPSGGEATVDGFFAEAWLDDTHLLGRTVLPGPQTEFAWSSHVQVVDLSGHRSDLVLGRLIGVLRP